MACVYGVTHASEIDGSVVQAPEKPPHCTIEQQPSELVSLWQLHNQSRGDGTRYENGRMRKAPNLGWSCELAVAALIHAKDMATNDFLGHQGSDGSSIGMRATRAAYRWRHVSENVAQGPQSSDQVYQGWISSGAHCENIMSDKYQEFGAAKVGHYWVVMLASP